MSDLVEIVNSLENKLKKLIGKVEKSEMNVNFLREELEKSNGVILQQSEEIESLKQQYDTLKSAYSLSGSNEYKRETKLKINSLIREIDQCIIHLSE
ncbi:MAG: hypothetical protein RBR78_07380 [Flavobacteriaceae bacterium]|jgi:chromosome segregation ATPase|nr:hypothetical protein [Flavobacteriaceae bacterium]HTO36245.1 hypothetical protein [Flavobacterium sp.]